MTETFTIADVVQQYAEQINGQFTDYDHTKSIIVVPLAGSRYQTVLVTTQLSPVSGREQVLISSKVCDLSDKLNFRSLMEQHANFDFCKFIIEDGYLKIEASCLAETVSEDQIKEMIQEVAQLADHYELKFTGGDVY